MPQIDLIDGNNWLNRAYYAAPKLTNSKGEPTGAIKAMCGMVQALYRALSDKGTPIIVPVFDGKRNATWRSKAVRMWLEDHPEYVDQELPGHEGYKGKRVSEDDIRSQLLHMQTILKAAGYPVFVGNTYEADDIIGTIASRFGRKHKVNIHSSDKDFAQLVTKNVTLVRPKDVIRPDGVVQVFGVKPSQIQDYLVMIGDGVDNIPGIPGIGSATAIKLLNEYGSLDALLKSVNSIKGNAQWLKALRGQTAMMDLDLQRELIHIDLNVPKLPKTLQGLKLSDADNKQLLKLKRRFELSSMLHV